MAAVDMAPGEALYRGPDGQLEILGWETYAAGGWQAAGFIPVAAGDSWYDEYPDEYVQPIPMPILGAPVAAPPAAPGAGAPALIFGAVVISSLMLVRGFGATAARAIIAFLRNIMPGRGRFTISWPVWATWAVWMRTGLIALVPRLPP